MQNDFISGSLALKNFPSEQNALEIIPIINGLIDEIPFDCIAYTLDWHPENHCSFINNVKSRKISNKSKVIFF
jgi:nicotinamidase-related amidase